MLAPDYQLVVPGAVWRSSVAPLLTGTARLSVGPLRRDLHYLPVGIVPNDLRPVDRASGDDQLPGSDWLVLTARAEFASVETCRQEFRPWRSQLLVVVAVGLEPEG